MWIFEKFHSHSETSKSSHSHFETSHSHTFLSLIGRGARISNLVLERDTKLNLVLQRLKVNEKSVKLLAIHKENWIFVIQKQNWNSPTRTAVMSFAVSFSPEGIIRCLRILEAKSNPKLWTSISVRTWKAISEGIRTWKAIFRFVLPGSLSIQIYRYWILIHLDWYLDTPLLFWCSTKKICPKIADFIVTSYTHNFIGKIRLKKELNNRWLTKKEGGV